MVKLALVYFIELSLLGKDKRNKVDQNFLKIADDWNTLDNYDWDGIVFGRMLSALKRALDIQHAKGKKKLTKTKYTIMGFLHALQVCYFLLQTYGYVYISIHILGHFLNFFVKCGIGLGIWVYINQHQMCCR